MPYTTGILLFDEAEELDFVGPLEVFGMARQDGDRVVTIAETTEPVAANLGLRVLPDHTIADAPPLDVLVVPGGVGTRREAENPAVLDWIKQAAAGCTWVTSVCTGSMLLEAAGVIDGRNVTTHWAMIDTFREKGTVTVLDNRRYVRHGNVVTAAGVSAGIDMSLWVVGQLYGVDHARGVQRFMEYDPAPPYAAEV
ncbi:MAG TPA: DJ-1/PfpI family protein [Acidimicrobiales bacterium]|jgi:transcriptional regulator GlxA family with amidase domain|nr:DJ-1/PfpI family protein [Acidimicrobiales bacterium]